MIAYFDTAAVIPLIIEELSTESCTLMWNESSRVVSTRLLYPEARAALAKAQRMGRLSPSQLRAAVDELDALLVQIDHIEVSEELAQVAGEMAQAHGLRGYDAVHLAAAVTVADGDLVLVTGDADLAAAAGELGLPVAVTSA